MRFYNLMAKRYLQQSFKRYKELKTPVFPEPPDPNLCCGSGCQNCVWIEYAQKVGDYFDTHPEGNNLSIQQRRDKIQRLLDENIADPSLRAYLSIEAKMKL
ncbi:unnamed protein product [Bursaphelenchus okinawaensis]|uniref:Oxidoreductase-like domain-containing protein n=1 Tax=Bursaphelenchus okinawaensis TaxID=465554 RepID=A0A811KU39_9BILA|nr:unnamed protein product [Bursaphelenchus okinawaensis]CAG9112444.1 unnamed protein product [Bursaphelenchus okinawaensis]